MPLHNWARVDPGVYHDFHNAWLVAMRNALNRGVLPEGFEALTDQRVTRAAHPDLITLRLGPPPADRTGRPLAGGAALPAPGAATVAAFEPLDQGARPRRAFPRPRLLVIRETAGERIVAVLDVVSPANKDRPGNVRQFARKVAELLDVGVQAMVLDPLPPGPFDPFGMHGAVAEYFTRRRWPVPADRPLLFTTYRTDGRPQARVEGLAVGSAVPDLPLFLDFERHVTAPLAATYDEAFGGFGPTHRRRIEGL